MTLTPGSFLWLLAHDLRLGWRMFLSMFGSARRPIVIAAVVAGTFALHLVAIPAVVLLKPVLDDPVAHSRMYDPVILAVFSWMVAQSVFATTRTLFDRGDLDLLMGSPLDAHQVMAAKASGIVCNTFGSAAFLLLPLAHAGVALDGPRWLALYPVLMSMVLVATSLAMLLTISLFFTLGARRARVVTHVVGALIGGGFILAVQVMAVMPDTVQDAAAALLGSLSGQHGDRLVGVREILHLPVRAMLGSFPAVVAMVGVGLLLFATAVVFLGERFVAASLAAAGGGTGGSAATRKPSRMHFRGGIGASMRRKEWRLLLRDASLFSQLGLQIVYTVPLVVVLLKSGALPPTFAIAPAIVVITAQVAASLAWITVSGEDAPELIATAPVTASVADRSKLSAIALPVIAIVALPLAGLAMLSPKAAALAAILAAAAATSTALINLWHPMPGNRRGMLRRHQQSKVIGLVEHALSFLWAIGSVMVMIGSAFAVVPLGVVGAILWFGRSRAHGRPAKPVAVNSRPIAASAVGVAAT